MAASVHNDRRTSAVKSDGRMTQPLDIQATKQIRRNNAISSHLTAESLLVHFTEVLTVHSTAIRPPVGVWHSTVCVTV